MATEVGAEADVAVLAVDVVVLEVDVVILAVDAGTPEAIAAVRAAEAGDEATVMVVVDRTNIVIAVVPMAVSTESRVRCLVKLLLVQEIKTVTEAKVVAVAEAAEAVDAVEAVDEDEAEVVVVIEMAAPIVTPAIKLESTLFL